MPVRTLALAFTLALLLAGSATAASTPRDACTVAKALLDAGLLSDAAAAYAAIPDAATRCAPDGPQRVQAARDARAARLADLLGPNGVQPTSAEVPPATAAALARLLRSGREADIAARLKPALGPGGAQAAFRVARALKQLGYPAAAGQVVASGLAAQPGETVPDDLRALTDASQHVDAALALQRAGLDSQANSELETAIKADPSIPVPDELATPNHEEPFWRRLLGKVGPIVITAVEILVAVLAIFTLLVGLPYLIAKIFARFRAQVSVNAFTGNPSAVGESTAVAVRENYRRLRSQFGGYNLKFVGASGEKTPALPQEVTSAYPDAGIVVALVALINAFVPSRVRELSGELRPRDAKRGAGVTLDFARRSGKVWDETTVWEADYGPLVGGTDDQAAYDRLAAPAAAWLMFQSAKRSFWRLLRRKRDLEILGTRDWRSYALFAVGTDDVRNGDAESARRRFLAALGQDPANRGAAFNLASTEHQLGADDPGMSASARKRLVRLRSQIEADGDWARDVLWYRALYMQVVEWLDPRNPDPQRARATAVKLCSWLLNTRDSFRRYELMLPVRRARYEVMKGFEPGAMVLLASTLVVDGHPPAAPAPWPPGTAVTRSRLRAALWAYDRAGDEGGGAFDAIATHDEIVQLVMDDYPRDAPTAYNLACYFTRCRNWSQAQRALDRAVEYGGEQTRAWALKDPVLEPYRTRQGAEAQLEHVIQGMTDPEPTQPAQPAPPGPKPKATLGVRLEARLQMLWARIRARPRSPRPS